MAITSVPETEALVSSSSTQHDLSSTNNGSNGNKKICFVIAPIGAEGSTDRVRSDQVLKHIITPAAFECGYDSLRADKISEPGLITSQVIQHIVTDPLVIADLSGHNPNVFYELALRHALKKPVVQIIQATEKIPFDLAASRTIFVDHHDLDSAAKAKEEIIKQIRSVEQNPTDVDTPISVAVELQSLRQSDNPLEKSNAEILTTLQALRNMVEELREERFSRPRIHPALIEELMMFFEEYHSLLGQSELPSHEDLEQLRHRLYRRENALEKLCMDAGFPPGFMRHRLRNRSMVEVDSSPACPECGKYHPETEHVATIQRKAKRDFSLDAPKSKGP